MKKYRKFQKLDLAVSIRPSLKKKKKLKTHILKRDIRRPQGRPDGEGATGNAKVNEFLSMMMMRISIKPTEYACTKKKGEYIFSSGEMLNEQGQEQTHHDHRIGLSTSTHVEGCVGVIREL